MVWATYGLEKIKIQQAYPPILTAKNWDKAKGVIAKVSAGKTGIGEACTKLQAAYQKVHWADFDLPEVTEKTLGTWGGDNSGNFTHANWTKLLNAILAKADSQFAPVVTQAFALRDLCQKTAKEFQKSKTIPSSATRHVLEMAKVADQFGVALNKNTIRGKLDQANKTFLQSISTMYNGRAPWLAAVAKNKNLVDQLRDLNDKDQLTASEFNSRVYGGCRPLTQNLGNHLKAADRGFIKADPKVRAVYADLARYGGNQAFLKGQPSKQDITRAILELDRVFQQAVALKL
jgi:hypothetical protein